MRIISEASLGVRSVGDAGGDRSGMAVTFDDGPDPRWTPAMLDVLDAHHVHATFFVVGQQASRYPALVQQIVDRGNVIGLHTWSHARLTRLSAGGFAQQVDPEIDLLTSLTGSRPQCLRPPYGAANPQTVALAADRGLKTVEWSIDPRDWTRPGTAAIVDRVDQRAAPDTIVLLHDGGGDRAETVAALSQILDHAQATGTPIVTVCGPPAPTDVNPAGP